MTGCGRLAPRLIREILTRRTRVGILFIMTGEETGVRGVSSWSGETSALATGSGAAIARAVTGWTGFSCALDSVSGPVVIGGFGCRVERSLLSGAKELLIFLNKRTMNITTEYLIVIDSDARGEKNSMKRISLLIIHFR
jgi:hypothetical protein